MSAVITPPRRDDPPSDAVTLDARSILRIGVGLLFMGHGAQKLFGWFGGFGGRPGATAELMTQMGLAGVLEFFGGLLIVLGLLTRPVALVLFLEMLMAYFKAHAPQGGLAAKVLAQPLHLDCQFSHCGPRRQCQQGKSSR